MCKLGRVPEFAELSQKKINFLAFTLAKKNFRKTAAFLQVWRKRKKEKGKKGKGGEKGDLSGFSPIFRDVLLIILNISIFNTNLNIPLKTNVAQI